MTAKDLKDKRVLLLGLGRLGGGVATAKWLFQKGVELTITDMLSAHTLENSLKQLKGIQAHYVLGKHDKRDIDWVDMVVVNPGVSYKNEYVQYAIVSGKQVENDCSLFFQIARGDLIAITGTRGKTTTSIWTHFLLSKLCKTTILGGNQPDKALLKIISASKPAVPSVLELSSFQLEFYRIGLPAPRIAAITNILGDHLNRYSNEEEYACAKAQIIANQNEDDFLILNADNSWTKNFLAMKPRGQLYFISSKKLSPSKNGVYINGSSLYLQENGKTIPLCSVSLFQKQWGQHNVWNVAYAILCSYLYTRYVSEKNFVKSQGKFSLQKFKILVKKYLSKLPSVPLRQQTILKSKKLTVINDSAATSPDAVIQALRRFLPASREKLVLITGGTDKNLPFEELAKYIKGNVRPEQIIFLKGSATQKLLRELDWVKFPYKNDFICDDLKTCLKKAVALNPVLILFSPGSASFEKFKNEFDRGAQFSALVKKL